MIDDFLRDPAGAVQMLLLMIPGLLLAVTIHEVAHGWVADRLGDPTARLAGRLTLDPRPHIDPLGALAFVLAGFGWACPSPSTPVTCGGPCGTWRASPPRGGSRTSRSPSSGSCCSC